MYCGIPGSSNVLSINHVNDKQGRVSVHINTAVSKKVKKEKIRRGVKIFN